jgi:hypothetical protein
MPVLQTPRPKPTAHRNPASPHPHQPEAQAWIAPHPPGPQPGKSTLLLAKTTWAPFWNGSQTTHLDAPKAGPAPQPPHQQPLQPGKNAILLAKTTRPFPALPSLRRTEP